MRAKLEEMDHYYIDFVSNLTPQDLERIIHYKFCINSRIMPSSPLAYVVATVPGASS